MIKRIVQMTFEPAHVDYFQQFFDERKATIKGFEGCQHLELWQDINQKNVFFTHSIWDSEHCLNQYRFSEFFKDTWGKTKAMFAAKPQAWSVQIL
jgi:quinol monooxygenase YgiN